ncbi:putative phosphothreonine lyase domain-containg protein [Thermorudis peleae]|uniref:putative phosphothreonine lyase domain-containing protein n=1 Tax=Thermorudis peleae TaxID=1382356 RepID=UPI00057045C8|nr:putative phosphothreonine lyase domain-containg protein [Thermorudis peleae]
MMTTRTRTPSEWCYAPGVERLNPQQAGFWRSILRPSYAGRVWDKVSAAVRAGDLGPAARLKPIAGGRRYELRIYVADVGDRDAVLRIRRVLRFRLGFVRPISCYDWHGRRRWLDPGARETTPRELWRRHTPPRSVEVSSRF